MTDAPLAAAEAAAWPAHGNGPAPQVTIMGTGAMACLFGARLHAAGAAVTLAGTWPAGMAALREGGIRLQEGGEVRVARVTVLRRTASLPPADLAIVLVKSHQTAAVVAPAASAARSGGLVLTLQNGLGSADALAAALGPDGVATGVTSAGATLLAPGVVAAAGPGETILAAPAARHSQVAAAARLLTAAGLPARVVADIAPWLWRKLAVNAAINPLSALLGVPNGALLDGPAARTMAAAAREVGAVASALGIAMPDDPVAVARAVARATAGNRSSMLQDLDRGALTEVDAISGAVVRRGATVGVATPVNQWLLTEVRRLESGARRRGPGSAWIPLARDVEEIRR